MSDDVAAISDPRRIGIIQRVLAAYRKPFFDRLVAASGLSVSVFAGQPLPGEEIRTVDTLEQACFQPTTNYCLPTPAGPVYWQSGVLTWLRQFQPDALVVPANPRILSNWLAVWQMHHWDRPVLGWGLGELKRAGPKWLQVLRHHLARRTICNLDGMIAYSEKAARDYQAFGVPGARVFVAHNVIASDESEKYLDKFGRNLSWLAAWKARCGLAPDLPIVLFVGRLIPQKRVDLLMEACSPLFDRCQVLIVGDGPSRLELERLAQGNQATIVFVGFRSGSELARCFIASDIFVLPGAGGLAIHQAMSYGKPVLVSFGDGTEANLVREGENGLFFEPHDLDDLRGKLSWLLDNPRRIKSMGERSLSIVRDEINLGSMVTVFERALSCASRST